MDVLDVFISKLQNIKHVNGIIKPAGHVLFLLPLVAKHEYGPKS